MISLICARTSIWSWFQDLSRAILNQRPHHPVQGLEADSRPVSPNEPAPSITPCQDSRRCGGGRNPPKVGLPVWQVTPAENRYYQVWTRLPRRADGPECCRRPLRHVSRPQVAYRFVLRDDPDVLQPCDLTARRKCGTRSGREVDRRVLTQRQDSQFKLRVCVLGRDGL